MLRGQPTTDDPVKHRALKIIRDEIKALIRSRGQKLCFYSSSEIERVTLLNYNENKDKYTKLAQTSLSKEPTHDPLP
jgi:hypothetical protein